MNNVKEYTFEELMQCEAMRELFELAVKQHYYRMLCESYDVIYIENGEVLDGIGLEIDYDDLDKIPWETDEEFLKEDEDVRNEWMEENCPFVKLFEKYGDGHLYALRHYHTDIKKEYEFYAKSDIEEFWDLILEFLEERGAFRIDDVEYFGDDEEAVIKYYEANMNHKKEDEPELKKIHTKGFDYYIFKKWVNANMKDSCIQVREILNKCDRYYGTIHKYLVENNLIVIS